MSDSDSNNNMGKIIGGVIIGLAAGAALGILLAPDKGSETRKKINTGAKELADNLKDKVMEGVDSIKQKFNDHARVNQS
ncbi:YtxH domain-containing protein [Aurantibacillus circumpalustris]|uniref:YtxH domain-containing protein n=1 Tax=Aurantibacillus circumpalustris TaxID=3036359 RepID=UPI00295B0D88|nr:YtxH domain-containing protein [Aurantibacillus circumpalustris]